MIAQTLIARTIQALLMEQGWNATASASGWRLVHAESEAQTVYACLSEHWLSFSQLVAQPRTPNEQHNVELFGNLLKVNERHMFLTKFALNAAGDLMLSAEVPLVGNYSQLIVRTLESFTTYRNIYDDVVSKRTLERKSDAAGTFTLPADTFMEYVGRIELYSWGSMKKPVGQTWHLGYKGRLRLYDAYFGVTTSWAVFQVPVLLKRDAMPEDPRSLSLFLRYLLRLNDELYLVKFGIGEEGQVLLLLEVPVQELNYELFLFAIRTLSKYLDSYTQELDIMSAPEREVNIQKLLLQADSIRNPSSVWF
ncbi:MAG TPA: hypothetical protein VN643_03655 [Pyrinomonadaceae bacterium]|nr:hypothetical protein [Pyrinomonadaceae bacterium]